MCKKNEILKIIKGIELFLNFNEVSKTNFSVNLRLVKNNLRSKNFKASEIYNFTDESDEDVVDEHGFILTFADGYVTPHNMWEYVTFKNHEFPKIQPGTQTVEVIGLDELIIVPRWWML